MLPEPSVYFVLVLFGAWVGVDSTSVGQFMVSRPVVSATLAGWIAGDVAAGALVGLVLEAVNLTVLPVGAARYPEIGPASVVAGAAHALGPQDSASLLAAVVFSVAWAWVAGVSVRYLRQINGRVVAPLVGEAATRTDRMPRLLELRHAASIGLDITRSTLLVAIGIPVLYGFHLITWSSWALPPATATIAVWSIVAASVAATIRLFGGRRIGLLIVGLLCGSVLLVLT